jgi:hypothetical protein
MNVEKFYKLLSLFKNMKQVIIFALILLAILASASFVMADTSGVCPDNQTIMRLSSAINAHSSLWNESYQIEICYDDYFTPQYSGSNPHDCTSSDLLLKLSAASNAHAAESSSASYPFSVCYKGLYNCRVETLSHGCGDKAAIVYLANTTNAHLLPGYNPPITNSQTGKYTHVLCCTGEGTLISISGGANSCYELDEDSCNTDDGTIAMQDIGCKATNKNSCECIWSSAKSKCQVAWNISISVPGQPDCIYQCLVDTNEVTECSGGSQIISLSRNFIPKSANCPLISAEANGCSGTGSATVSCGTLEANLPFFGIWQLFASIVSIVLIYSLFLRKRFS